MGQVIEESTPMFQVRPTDGIAYIYFRVADNPQFMTPVESGPVATTPGQPTTWQTPTAIIAGLVYYWQISADNQVWTAPISFSALLDIHPYPNPVKASLGHTDVVFTNLLDNSDITIATNSGEIVFEVDDVGPGEWAWDLRNRKGREIASGVYLYHVDFASGSTSGKLMLIK
jgi:hypothetical protein